MKTFEKFKRKMNLKILTRNGNYFAKLSLEQRNDEEMALIAIKTAPNMIIYLGEKLKNDENFIIKCVKENYKTIEFLGDEHRNNKNICMAAILVRRYQVDFIGDSLTSDEEVMLEAIKAKPITISRVDEKLRNDLSFMQKAMKIDLSTFSYASDRIKNDPQIIIQLIKEFGGEVVKYTGRKFLNNAQVMFEAMIKAKKSALVVGEELRNDKDFIAKLESAGIDCEKNLMSEKEYEIHLAMLRVENNGLNLKSETEEFKNNPNVALLALKNCAFAWRYVGENLKEDEEFCLKAFKINNNVGKMMDERMLNNIHNKTLSSIICQLAEEG